MSREASNRKAAEAQEPSVGLLTDNEKKAFQDRLKKWLPELVDAQLQAMTTYCVDLVKFNNAINLISATTARNADSIHFADSVLANRLIIKKLLPNSPLFDIGSGNGFPGLIMAILNPQLPVVLVDRDSRKIEFCKHISSLAKLKNVSFEIATVEEMPAGKMQNVVSRGFAPLHKAMLLTRKSVVKGGRYFHMKGDGWAAELAAVPSQLFSFWSPSLVGQYRLPESSSDMAVVLTEKIAD